MKKFTLLIPASFFSLTLLAQTEIELRTDGIVVPRTDTSSVTNPTEGMMIYDTNLNTYVFYDGTQWQVQGAIDQLDTAPCNPTHVGSISDDGTTELNGAVSIFVSGVEILDISDPTNPTHVGSISDSPARTLGGARSIYVSGNYAYVAANLDHGVAILDISDPTNPTQVGSIIDDATSALLGATSIYVSGKYAYVAADFDDGVEILDISDPTNPTHVGSITDDEE